MMMTCEEFFGLRNGKYGADLKLVTVLGPLLSGRAPAGRLTRVGALRA